MSEAHCNNLVQRKALGLVTHDNTGGPFVVECQGCGKVYPSFHCLGGEQIADTGDHEDARCPHCDQLDPEECDNAALAWNTQQLKINELQLLLNERDEQVHSLEQRRHAEQQACQAAERDAARYRWLRKVTPYRFRKMQDAAVTDGGDVVYFHSDRFDAAVDAAIEASLNPTAEAASHVDCGSCRNLPMAAKVLASDPKNGASHDQ